jgi:hypothetical protein
MLGLQGLGVALLMTGQAMAATIPSESATRLTVRGMPEVNNSYAVYIALPIQSG